MPVFTLQCVLSARFTVLRAQSVQLRFTMLRAQSMQLKMRPGRELALRGKFSNVVPRPLVDFGELARPIAVAVDTQVTCTEPAFNPIVRQSGIIVDAVRNLTGKRGVRKDFPENARRSVFELSIAIPACSATTTRRACRHCLLSSWDRASHDFPGVLLSAHKLVCAHGPSTLDRLINTTKRLAASPCYPRTCWLESWPPWTECIPLA